MKFHNTLDRFFYEDYEVDLEHRYITNDHIKKPLKKLPGLFQVSTIGTSVNELPIYRVKIGSGPKKVLMWSQMHGNESTTTKALFDVFNSLSSKRIDSIAKKCTLYVIPILNPDGAKAYTRENANGVDLNRDAQELSQPESKVLRNQFETIKPDYCFNLHGQRTIFSAGHTNKPATISFLAPAQNQECTVTLTRKIAMDTIVRMNEILQEVIPNQVGIYDDAFNINCAGDTFQSLNVPTILFEAGHYKNDYNREKVRKFIYMSLLVALRCIANNSITGAGYKKYLDIPKNQKLFYDIIIRDAVLETQSKPVDIAIQYKEILEGRTIKFKPEIRTIGQLQYYYAHRDVNAGKTLVIGAKKQKLFEGYANDFVFINNELFSLIL